MEVRENQVVIESAHPYQPDEDHTWPIEMEGADTIEVRNQSSRTFFTKKDAADKPSVQSEVLVISIIDPPSG